jgi:hypothetical protein
MNGKDRRGALMIVALACLLISLSLVATMIQGALRDRRNLRSYRDQRQTHWLVQSAAERAAYRLAHEPDYRGETWKPVVGDGKLAAAGEVVVEATREADDEPWHVRIVAEYPAGVVQSVRQSHRFEISTVTPSDSAQAEE